MNRHVVGGTANIGVRSTRYPFLSGMRRRLKSSQLHNG
jgi:hypothetical protein